MRASILALVVLSAATVVSGESESDRNPALLRQMRGIAEATAVGRPDSAGPRAVERAEEPVFRYSDPPRRIDDGTLWLWHESGRPVAVEKIEAGRRGNGDEAWTVCFASLSTELLEVRWSGGRTYRSARPVQFRPLPDAPEPVRSDRLRQRQFRSAARRFEAEIANAPDWGNVQQMRLLPRPIYEYGGGASDGTAGAVFGFTCNGTNPDACLILEMRHPEPGKVEWRYAIARLTTGGLRIRLDGREVSSENWVPPDPAPFETWTFFFEARDAE